MKTSSSLRDVVYESIMDDIINEVYKPFQIISERSVVEKYNCSKSPAREAMLSLCNDQILRSIPRCGYEVLPVTKEDVHQILNYRYLLEGGFMKISIKQISDTQLDLLTRLSDELPQCRDDVWKYWDVNTQFHLELIKAAHNQYAYYELDRICSRLKIGYAMLNKRNKEEANFPLGAKNHKAIVECLRRRNIAAALDTLYTDLSDFGCIHFTLDNFFSAQGQ